MKKKTLDKVIDALLFEADTIGMPDIVYGIYDRPGPTEKAGPEFEPTVPPEVPLKPTEMMSSQLAVERPPIEDGDYVPTTVSDLRQAAQAIAGLVPPDQVEKFYRQSLELLDRMEKEDMLKNPQEPVQVAAEEDMPKTESHRRDHLSALIEALEDSSLDPYSPRAGERMRSPYDPRYTKNPRYEEDFGDYDKAVEAEEGQAPAATDEDEVLEQLAKQFGYKGASGMRQALHRLFELMKYLITKVGATKIENMMGTVVPEFIELGVELDIFDKEDAVDLMASPVYVREMDSFRNYFNALYRPVYQKLRAEKEKEVRQEIEDLGVPKAAVDSVYYQLAGTSARKDSTIAKKLPPNKAKEILATVSQNFDRLKRQMDQIPDTLLDLAHERVDALGDQKKKQMVIDAFNEAGEFREQFGESRRRCPGKG